ncbi:MAG: tail fiber domain-containing protein [Cyanobacteria bacterium J06635_10]
MATTDKEFDSIIIKQEDTKQKALSVIGNVTGDSLAYFEQQGKNKNVATFVGGSGVDIKDISGKQNALYIYNNQTEKPTAAILNKGSGAVLHVKQEGSGNAAEFEGGSGVDILRVTGKNHALAVYNNQTEYPSVWIGNKGTGPALSVKQEGGSDIASFRTKKDKSKFVIGHQNSDVESISLAIYQAEQPVWKPTTNLSDLSLAENITPIENALDKVLSLEGVSFTWKDKALGKDREISVSAEKVGKVLPELVHSGLVKYEKLVPVLIEAIKAQQKQIEELQTQVESLKNQ